MTTNIRAVTITRAGYTLTQSSSGLVTVKRPDGPALVMLSNGRRLSLSTADGFLMAYGRDVMERGAGRIVPVFSNPERMLAIVAGGGII